MYHFARGIIMGNHGYLLCMSQSLRYHDSDKVFGWFSEKNEKHLIHLIWINENLKIHHFYPLEFRIQSGTFFRGVEMFCLRGFALDFWQQFLTLLFPACLFIFLELWSFLQFINLSVKNADIRNFHWSFFWLGWQLFCLKGNNQISVNSFSFFCFQRLFFISL